MMISKIAWTQILKWRNFVFTGAHLVLGSRNLEKGEQTKRELEDLKGKYNNPD